MKRSRKKKTGATVVLRNIVQRSVIGGAIRSKKNVTLLFWVSEIFQCRKPRVFNEISKLLMVRNPTNLSILTYLFATLRHWEHSLHCYRDGHPCREQLEFRPPIENEPSRCPTRIILPFPGFFQAPAPAFRNLLHRLIWWAPLALEETQNFEQTSQRMP